MDPTQFSTFNAEEELQRAGAPNYRRHMNKSVRRYIQRRYPEEARNMNGTAAGIRNGDVPG